MLAETVRYAIIISFLIINFAYTSEILQVEINYDPQHFKPFKVIVEDGKIKYWPGGQYNSVDSIQIVLPDPAYSNLIKEIDKEVNVESFYKADDGVSMNLSVKYKDGSVKNQKYRFKNNNDLLASVIHRLYEDCQTKVRYFSRNE